MANEFEAVLAIKHDAQIAYEEAFDFGLSQLRYSALWEKFDAVECDRHVYRLNVPLKLRPLPFGNRVHRARARDRRRNWDDICAKRALAHDRLSHGFSKLNCTGVSTLEPVHSRGASLADRLDALAAERSRPWWRRLVG